MTEPLKDGINSEAQQKHAQDYVGFAAHLIDKWNLHDHVDLAQTCEVLIELQLYYHIYNLIGKSSSYEEAKKVQAQHTFINNLLKRDIKKHAKICEHYCNSFSIDINDFAILAERKHLNTITKAVSSHMNLQRYHRDYAGAEQVEDSFKGQKDMLILLCHHLLENNRTVEAKGVCVRNNLTAQDFA